MPCRRLLFPFLSLLIVPKIVSAFTMSAEPVKGVWRRLWEEDPLGDTENADRDTLVLWTQAPKSGIYVDIRLPLGSPGREGGYSLNPSALQARGMDASKLTPEQISIVLNQKSFAGVLEYSLGDTTSGDALAKDQPLADLAANTQDNGALSLCTCFWKRVIDYQPPSGGLDIGVCVSAPPNADGSIDLRETGDDASYAEGWHRLPGTNVVPFLACKLISEDGIERSGYWVRTGNRFAYSVGRPKDAETAKKLGCAEPSSKLKECVGKSLGESVQSLGGDVAAQFLLVGSYMSVFGEIIESGNWNILHSTDYGLVGCQLAGDGPTSCSTLSREDGAGEIQLGDCFSQLIVGGSVRKWEVMEIDSKSNLPGLSE
jgi:hypothetical protein